MVRTDRWKYVFTTGKEDLALGYETGRGPSGRDQRLYDMADDPGEFRDLADDPRNAAVIGEMRAEMRAVFLRTHPRAPDLPAELTVEEKLEWVSRTSGELPGPERIRYRTANAPRP